MPSSQWRVPLTFRTCVSVKATVCAMLGPLVLSADGDAADPFAFFQPTVSIPVSDRHRLDRGETLVRVLPGTDGQVAVFAAARVNATPEQVLERMHHIETLKTSPFVPIVRRFSNPPVPDDLAELTLEHDELYDVRRCRPRDCDLQLSAAEITRLRAAASRAPIG